MTGYNKKATPSQNRKAREIPRNLNLNIHAALMINPDFDKEDFEIVHKAIEELSPAEFAFTDFSPPPGTEAFATAKDSSICDDPSMYYDCLHTILPTKLPLKTFYRYFSILYGKSAARIPPRINKVRVPIKDFAKLAWQGIKFARQLHGMYRDYDRKYW